VMQRHRDAFKEAGCSGFLSKPIKRSKLYALLKSHFPAAAAVGVDEALPEEEALPGEEVLEDEEDLSSLIDDEMWQEFWDYLSDAELNLQQAWEQREWDRLRSVAHAIKGMGSSYGQPEMTEIAAGLQDAAPGGDPGVIEPLYRQLVDLLQQQNPNHAE
jgi:HPt (histidine-containing phosphotransfer) domain-containing protein